MAVICNTCGLPDDLCACGELDQDNLKIVVRLELRRFRKKGTMIEGFDSKTSDMKALVKQLRSAYACGGAAKDGYIILQGDHRDSMKDTLVKMGFQESSIEIH